MTNYHLSNRRRTSLTPVEDQRRVKCPKCMGYLTDAMLKELPESEWQRPSVLLADGHAMAPIRRYKAIGNCFVHGTVSTTV